MEEISTKSKEKSDRRILKTKRNLRQSLIELMKTKPFEKITIREICDYADVNRNTFYYHYDCTQALLDEILSTLLDEIKDAVDGITNISEGIWKLCAVYQKNGELMRILLVEHTNISFCQKLVKVSTPFADIAVSDFNKDISDAKKEMISNYIAFGTLAIFYTWLKQDKEMEIDEVCRVIDALMHFDPIQAIKNCNNSITASKDTAS